jgi:lysophospholipase L1-like esterase
VVLAVAFIFASCISILLTREPTQTFSNKPINVSCVGDSITQWSGYPAYLQDLLGTDYNVGNFGVAGSAVSTKWFKPYVEEIAFQDSLDFDPSIVIIMLGTNDAHNQQSTDSFVDDYETLVTGYEALPGDQQIILVKPPPIYDNDLELNGTSLQKQIIPFIEQVGSDMSLPVLDLNTALMYHPEYFVDGVHLNDYGALAIATELSQAITFGDYEAGAP